MVTQSTLNDISEQFAEYSRLLTLIEKRLDLIMINRGLCPDVVVPAKNRPCEFNSNSK